MRTRSSDRDLRNTIKTRALLLEIDQDVLDLRSKNDLDLDGLLRKEVIQPQVPLRLPCYDFTPVTSHTIGGCLPYGLAHRLPVQLTPMV